MGIRGTFKDFSVSDIIQLIHFQKKSGRMSVYHKGRTWVVGFEKGTLVQANLDDKGMLRLGEILVRQGYIDREKLSEALRLQEEKPRPLGKVLEDMGVVSHDDIARALNFQIQETALNLFFHQEGEYMFERVPVTYDTNYISPINTEFLLMEGARRVDEWPSIRKAVLGGDAVFKKPDGQSPEVVDKLPGEYIRVFEAVDGVKTVEQLVNEVGIGLFETTKALGEMITEKHLEMVRMGTQPFRDPVSGEVLEPEPDASTVTPPDPAQVAAAEAAAEAAEADEADMSSIDTW